MSTPANYILFVDDDDDDRQLLQECCEQLGGGVRTFFLTSGEAVFQFLASLYSADAFPSLIVLDVNMPGMGGGEVLLRLKRNSLYRHIPVVIHSTAAHLSSQYATLGAAAFCPKGSTYAQWQRNVSSFFQHVLPSPSALTL